MNELHLKYKQDTGRSSLFKEFTVEESVFIQDHYLIAQSEIDSHVFDNSIKIIDPEYVKWLEEKANEKTL